MPDIVRWISSICFCFFFFFDWQKIGIKNLFRKMLKFLFLFFFFLILFSLSKSKKSIRMFVMASSAPTHTDMESLCVCVEYKNCYICDVCNTTVIYSVQHSKYKNQSGSSSFAVLWYVPRRRNLRREWRRVDWRGRSCQTSWAQRNREPPNGSSSPCHWRGRHSNPLVSRSIATTTTHTRTHRGVTHIQWPRII